MNNNKNNNNDNFENEMIMARYFQFFFSFFLMFPLQFSVLLCHLGREKENRKKNETKGVLLVSKYPKEYLPNISQDTNKC